MFDARASSRGISIFFQYKSDVTKSGNGERKTWNVEWEMQIGNVEWENGMGN